MLTLISENHGQITPGTSLPGFEFQAEYLLNPGFEAELLTIKPKADEKINFTGVPWPYTLIFVFGYSIVLYLNKDTKKEIHDRGGHLFYSVNGSYKIRFQKGRRYLIFSIHYASEFVKQNLEGTGRPIRPHWELSSPVFYYARPRIAERTLMDSISTLMVPKHIELDDDFIRNELARSLLMDFWLETEGSFQPGYIGASHFETFYAERDRLVAVALKTKPVSGLLALAEIHQIPLFRKRLRQLYDLNIRGFLTELRMSAALNLLIDPALSIKEIAAITGFSSAFYFSRVFTNYFGQSPKYFHAKHTDNLNGV